MKFYKADSAGNMTPFEGDGQIRYDETLTANKTLTVNDSGKVFLIGTDGLTITLPSTVTGLEYTFINIGADGAVGITVEPAAADKLMGSFNQNGSMVTMSGTDDKGIVNTKATANNGDALTILGDGDDGWYVKDCNGIWTEESQTVVSASFVDGVITSDITQTADSYGWAQKSVWRTGADMTSGGTYGTWGLARVGHSTQNALGSKGQLYFRDMAADETINIGAAIEASLDLSDTWGLTVASHLSGLSVSVTGTGAVTGSGDYNKFNGAYVYWYTITNFGIETNGFLVETRPSSNLDYGFNVYNSGTMTAGLWIHNNVGQGGTMVSDVLLSSGAKVFTGSAANSNAVYAEIGTDGATGSIYLSTAGLLFVQVAHAGANADWETVTTS